MKKMGMSPKTLNLVTKVAIAIAIVLLIWVVFDSFSYYGSKRCDSEIQFKQIGECSEQQCEERCAVETFDGELMAHKFAGRKLLVSDVDGQVIKEEMCVCECSGCKTK